MRMDIHSRRVSMQCVAFPEKLERAIVDGKDKPITRRKAQALGLSGYRYANMLHDGLAVLVKGLGVFHYFVWTSEGLRIVSLSIWEG